MARRRQKNSLLPKMIIIAVVVNAILLPLLAQLGVFKAIHREQLEPVRLVELPRQKKPAEPKRPPRKLPPKRHAVPPHPAGRHQAHPASSRQSRPNPNQPKVVVASGSGPGNGPSVEQGTQNGGTLPTNNAPSGPPSAAASAPPPAVTNTPPPQPTPAPTPVSPPPAPAPPPPHVPVVVAAVPVSRPEPKIPDDIDYGSVHGEFKAVFLVHADGHADVKLLDSTGDERLDTIALDAARQWTFHPGMVDGRPYDSYLRLTIQFEPA